MRPTLVLVFLVACGGTPTPTGTVCADPDPGTLTYENFGKPFMEKYCTWCHAGDIPRSNRNGAPIYHDYDTLLGVLQTPDHIDEQAGSGPNASNDFMPPSRCPSVAGGKTNKDCEQPTEEERQQLSEWIACERYRPHTF
ncbi:MAG: hypothetical protein ABI175_10740 [Polyangiales bacterium]